MKEFDFEELDRAVNSLMSDVKKPAETAPVSEPATNSTSEQSASLPPDSATTDDTAVTVSETPTPAEEKTKTPPTPSSLSTDSLPTRPATPVVPPRRGGGRFMDVVHPSSDMSSTPSPASVSTRQGKPLQPITMNNETPVSRPVVDVMAPAVPSPAEPAAPSADDTPATATDSSANSSPESGTSNDPWSSPFLPGAQVEKRPLGGATESPTTGLSDAIAAELNKELPSDTPSVEPAETEPTKESEPIKEEASSSAEPASDLEASSQAETDTTEPPKLETQALPATPDSEPVTMPAELNNDLVAIESGQKAAADETMTLGSFESASNTTGFMPVAIASLSYHCPPLQE